MPVRSPRADATARRILHAATACFADRGFEGTTTRAIATRAEVTQPLVLHYYGSKQGLFDAVMERYIDEYIEAQSAQWSRDTDDIAFFTEGLAVLFAWMGADPQRTRLLRWARLEGRIQPTKAMIDLGATVTARFEAAQRHGILRADVPTWLAQMVIDATISGYWERREEYCQRSPDLEPEFDARFLAVTMPMMIDTFFTPEAAAKAHAELARTTTA